jgi:hypothetical protein
MGDSIEMETYQLLNVPMVTSIGIEMGNIIEMEIS